MKRIFCCLLLILGLLSGVACAAEESVNYQNKYLSANFPAIWEVSDYGFSIRATSPDNTSSILICPYPQKPIPLDKKVAMIEKDFPLFNQSLEEHGSLYIDNVEARYSLCNEKNKNNVIENYRLYYYFFKGQSFYMIWAVGKYDNLESDRKIISKVVSSLKILQTFPE